MNSTKNHDNSSFAKPERYPGFERWWHRVIVATEAMVAFNIFCGLLGLFGTGPLSTATASVADPSIVVTYQRITRRSLQSELIIKTKRQLSSRKLEVLLPGEFGSAFEVVATSPPARDIRAEKEGNMYTFDFGLSREGEARFSIKPRQSGVVHSLAKIGDGTARLLQIVLP